MDLLWITSQTLGKNRLRHVPAHDEAIFWMVDSGRARLEIGGQRLEVESGQAVLQLGNAPRELQALEAFGWRAFGFRVANQHLCDLVANLRPPLVWRPGPTERALLESCYLELASHRQRWKSAHILRSHGALMTVLGLCYEHSELGDRPLNTVSLPEWLQKAMALLTENPRREVTGVAAAVGYSPSQFRLRFHRETGLAPREYAALMLGQKAQHHLDTSEKSVDAIARELGFSAAPHFVRFFKKQFGVTPAVYRHRHLHR